MNILCYVKNPCDIVYFVFDYNTRVNIFDYLLKRALITKQLNTDDSNLLKLIIDKI